MNSSLRKAAVVLMSLPEELAAEVLGKLRPKQIEAVSIEIARLSRLSAQEQQEVIYEFARANPASAGAAMGGLELARALVEKALGREAAATLDNVQQSIAKLPFGSLRRVDPQDLVTFLGEEQPQTIALVLSHMPPDYGAQVLAKLPADRQLAVIRRIAQMSQTSPEVIQEVEQGLELRMADLMNQSFNRAGGVASVAGMLNVADRSTERTLLENLAQDDPGLVEEIRRLMFVFEDIAKLADKDVQTVLKNVESSQWARALKGSSAELQQKVLGNMSQRASQLLREEMEYLGPVRLSEVESAQQQIVDIVRALEDSGEISSPGSTADEEFVT